MDCIFRVQSQGHAHRFVLYHQQYPHIYPASFGTEAIEIGPRTDKEGPCLVLFRNVETAPEVVNAWTQHTVLKSSLGRVLWVSNSAASQTTTQQGLLERLTQLCRGLGGVVRLQCEPRSLEGWLGDHLPEDILLRKAGATHVVNVLQWEGRFRYAAQPVRQFWQNSPTKGQRVADQLSKAAGKLAEAVEVAGEGADLGGVAIDLGAAPGGWTAYLAQRAKRVVAIDPAELDPRALLSNVTHLRCKAEVALPLLEQVLGVGEGGACGCSTPCSSSVVPPRCGSMGGGACTACAAGARKGECVRSLSCNHSMDTRLCVSFSLSLSLSLSLFQRKPSGSPPPPLPRSHACHVTTQEAAQIRPGRVCPAVAAGGGTEPAAVRAVPPLGGSCGAEEELLWEAGGGRGMAGTGGMYSGGWGREGGPAAMQPAELVSELSGGRLGGPPEGLGAGGADLVVCDMNHHPADLLPLLRRMLHLLRPGGLAIFTLKFFGIGRDKSQWEGKLREELEQEGFSRVRLVWLVANTMSERTCLAWKEPRVLTQGVRVSGC